MERLGKEQVNPTLANVAMNQAVELSDASPAPGQCQGTARKPGITG
jgi:hypothetical protein